MKTLRVLILTLFTVAFMSVQSLAADPTGVWKWTTPGRNNQPQETILKLELSKEGVLTGSLTDRSGTLPISDASFKGNKVEFSVVREIPGGKIETTYSGQINGDTLSGTNARPDKSPAAVAANKKRQADWIATREPVKGKG